MQNRKRLKQRQREMKQKSKARQQKSRRILAALQAHMRWAREARNNRLIGQLKKAIAKVRVKNAQKLLRKVGL